MLRTHDNSLKSLYGSLLGTYPSYLICSSYSRPLGSGRPSQLYGRSRYQTHILLFFVLSYEDSSCRGNYRTSHGILRLRKHNLRWCQMQQRNQEKDSNEKRSLFQEGRTTKWRTEKMSQVKNGENTDLECDLILCSNIDSEKGGHHNIGSLWNVDMV